MPRFDMILITTIEADSYDDACNYIVDFADDLADTHHMPFTGEYKGMAQHDNDGQRVFYLLPESVGSLYEGPIEMDR